jgi:hypothetical protein
LAPASTGLDSGAATDAIVPVAADDTRGDQVVVDLDKQGPLDLVVAVLEGRDLHDQQLVRTRHADLLV